MCLEQSQARSFGSACVKRSTAHEREELLNEGLKLGA